jgi:KDO2-lipid IV(A) lauroyltransferase
MGNRAVLTEFINSQVGPWMGFWIARLLPQRQAYAFGRWVARLVARRTDTFLYRAVRSNQAVVRGLEYHSPKLEGVVERVLIQAANGYVDWYKSIAHGNEFVEKSIIVEDHILGDAWQARNEGHGVVYAGGHLSNFNMFLMILGIRDLPIQVLSYHEESGSYRSDNAMRKRFNINVTPISMDSLRTAIRRLKQNGFVLTGVDRPDTGGEKLIFFGHQVTLPIGHARLAVNTGSFLKVGVVQSIRDGLYRATGPRILEPEITGDNDRDIINLAQRTIDILSKYIEERPSEWLMFYPVFPSAMPN